MPVAGTLEDGVRGAPRVRAFIQARMSSARFPGKVLAPLGGRPVIAHLIARVQRFLPANRIVVACSEEPSDDPLASYLHDLGIAVFRGSLENVLERLQRCLQQYPCTWFFRLCADSPLLHTRILQTMLAYTDRTDVDLVTNVFPRTFPRGCSAELLKASVFAALDSTTATPEEQEHATAYYYHHPERFAILNIDSGSRDAALSHLAVDTIEDLVRLEPWLDHDDTVLQTTLSE